MNARLGLSDLHCDSASVPSMHVLMYESQRDDTETETESEAETETGTGTATETETETDLGEGEEDGAGAGSASATGGGGGAFGHESQDRNEDEARSDAKNPDLNGSVGERGMRGDGDAASSFNSNGDSASNYKCNGDAAINYDSGDLTSNVNSMLCPSPSSVSSLAVLLRLESPSRNVPSSSSSHFIPPPMRGCPRPHLACSKDVLPASFSRPTANSTFLHSPLTLQTLFVILHTHTHTHTYTHTHTHTHCRQIV